MVPLRRSGLPSRQVLQVGFAADTVSITVMEIVDNTVVLVIPGFFRVCSGAEWRWRFWWRHLWFPD